MKIVRNKIRKNCLQELLKDFVSMVKWGKEQQK